VDGWSGDGTPNLVASSGIGLVTRLGVGSGQEAPSRGGTPVGDRDLAAVRIGQLLDQGQSKAGAAPDRERSSSRRTTRSQTRSRSAGGTPGPSSSTANTAALPLHSEPDLDRRARVPQRVVDQVRQQAADLRLIAEHDRGLQPTGPKTDPCQAHRGVAQHKSRRDLVVASSRRLGRPAPDLYSQKEQSAVRSAALHGRRHLGSWPGTACTGQPAGSTTPAQTRSPR
jgi:hypothetical protein